MANGKTITQITTADSVSTNDEFPIWQISSNATRKASLLTIVDFLRNFFTGSLANMPTRTSLSNSNYIICTDSNGTEFKITLGNFRSSLTST